MSLRLKNTLTNKTEKFSSIEPGKVSIYCCGVTVYDLCHIGHARSYVIWDALRRYLIWQGYKVTFVQNFTDIDDKILRRAEEENSSMTAVSEKNIKEFYKDMDSLGILRADKTPKATKCIKEIQLLITQLESKGAAYSIDGDVYFSVQKFSSYGKLSGRNLESQKTNAGGRLNVEEKKKKNSFDFALWKNAKEGEPSFSSPWGCGRPGWHIECSAMVRKELGETIDIHLGGSDLIFPHHENEIAQSEAANGKSLANYWLHNGMVNVNGQKMSKSLGNFTTIRSLIEKGISPMAIRFFILQTHYRKPLDFTIESLNGASKGWEGLNSALSIRFNYPNLLDIPEIVSPQKYYIQQKKVIENEELSKLSNKFVSSINDDLNTAGALAIIFELAKPLKSLANQLKRGTKTDNINQVEKANLYSRWEKLIELSGVLGLAPELKSSNKLEFINRSTIEIAIKDRIAAKNKKNYLKADKIREDLRKKGIELIDKPDGSTEWIRN